ncbi:hypothetical protein ACOSP7_026941 [Xanthoceras sorbifolium]
MATAQTIIAVQNGKLFMTVLGETVEFQLKRMIEEEQCLDSTGAEDPKTCLGVKMKSRRKKKPKPCYEELQLQLLGYLIPRKGELSRHERITGHAVEGVLDMH